MLQWLEITADYQCNNRCVGCFSAQEAGPSMSTAEVLRLLSLGREHHAGSLWLGGGEPTLRKDLFAIVAAARRAGYARIKLQTNGMLLAYPEFARRLAASGVTEVNFAIKGASEAQHDTLTATPGCFRLLVEGIAQARRAGLALESDVLVYRSNAAALPDIVRVFTPMGIARHNLWLFSAMGSPDPLLRAEAPRIDEVVPHLVRAIDLGLGLGLSRRRDFITSLHTPPCTVPASHHACLFHAPDLALLVTNPGGFRFMLEASPIEGGMFFDRCSGCGMRARCDGARADYVAQHGDREFQPI